MSLRGRSWILTHGISGGFITYDMLQADIHLQGIDECHYTSDAVVVYTYVHFANLVSIKHMQEFTDRMKATKNIILFEIFGYDSIATGSESNLTDHIGFKMLLNHYQTNHPAFHSCTSGVPGVARGLLWKNDSIPRIRECLTRSSTQWANYFNGMEKELIDLRQKSAMMDLMRDQLAEHEARIQRQRDLIKELKHFEFISVVLKYRISQLDQATQNVLLAPDHRGRPI